MIPHETDTLVLVYEEDTIGEAQDAFGVYRALASYQSLNTIFSSSIYQLYMEVIQFPIATPAEITFDSSGSGIVGLYALDVYHALYVSDGLNAGFDVTTDTLVIKRVTPLSPIRSFTEGAKLSATDLMLVQKQNAAIQEEIIYYANNP